MPSRHPRVSSPIAHRWAFTFRDSSCTAKESSLVARPYQNRLHTHAAVRTEPGDRTLRTWLVRPRTSPAVLARRGSGPWTRTTMTSVKGSRPTVRRSQNGSPRAESNRVARRSEHRRQSPLARAWCPWTESNRLGFVRSEAAGSAGRDVGAGGTAYGYRTRLTRLRA